MRLSENIDARSLAKWSLAAEALERPVELHVLTGHWELRCEGLEPFRIEWTTNEDVG